MPYPVPLHPQKDKHRDCNTMGCIRLINSDCVDWKAAAIKHAEAEARAVQYGQFMTTVATMLLVGIVLMVLIIWRKP